MDAESRGHEFDYTVRSGDDLNAIATGLAGVVDASALYAAQLSSSSLTVTLQTGGQPFTLAYSTTAADGAFAVEETPYERRWQSASITLTDDLDGNGTVVASEVLKQGDVWSVTLDGTEFSYTAPAGATLTSIAQQLAQQINAADTASNIFTGRTAGGRTYVATATGARLADHQLDPEDVQSDRDSDRGRCLDRYPRCDSIQLYGSGGDTLESVAKALQDAIADGTDFTASRSGSSLIVTRANAGPAFTLSASRSFLVPATNDIKAPSGGNDNQADSIRIYGNSGKADEFIVESTTDTIQLVRRVVADGYSLSYEIDNAKRFNGVTPLDSLTIYSDTTDPWRRREATTAWRPTRRL